MTDPAELFPTRLPVTPPLDDEKLRAIPAKRGVVLLADEQNRPIVLFTAADMRSRLRNRLAEPHEDASARRADLRVITRSVLLQPTSSHFETDWRQLELARQLWPGRYRGMVGVKPPWCVRLDLEETYPHFARTRDLAPLLKNDRPGLRAWGPFATARDAEGFIEALQDAFDLCRSLACLRKSPTGPRCAYAEMNRCLSPADGSISMDDYRVHLARAGDCASGDRARRAELQAAMQQAAATQAYEQAAGWKQRLDRLAALDHPRYRYTAPLADFAWLVLQPGFGRRELACFLAGRGTLAELDRPKLPLTEATLASLLRRARTLTEAPPPPDDAAGLRMGLLSRTLLQQGPRRGLPLRLADSLTPSELARRIVDAAGDLQLSEPLLAED